MPCFWTVIMVRLDNDFYSYCCNPDNLGRNKIVDK